MICNTCNQKLDNTIASTKMARTRSTKKVKGGWENAKLVQWNYFKERKKNTADTLQPPSSGTGTYDRAVPIAKIFRRYIYELGRKVQDCRESVTRVNKDVVRSRVSKGIKT